MTAGRTKDNPIEQYGYSTTATKVLVLGGDGENRLSSSNPFTTDIVKYNTNNIIEASSTLTYFGMEDKNGNWLVKKIDTTSGAAFSYATINNNSSYATYDTAWTARASLTYENYGEAF